MLLLANCAEKFWNSTARWLQTGLMDLCGPSESQQREASEPVWNDAWDDSYDGWWSGGASMRNHSVKFCYYKSAGHLQQLLQDISSWPCPPMPTVMLALDPHFSGYLPTLLKRRNRGGRLMLVMTSGRLPGLLTAGDLAAIEAALGWDQIVVEREIAPAIQGSLDSLESGEPLLMFWPAWHDRPRGLASLERHGCRMRSAEECRPI